LDFIVLLGWLGARLDQRLISKVLLPKPDRIQNRQSKKQVKMQYPKIYDLIQELDWLLNPPQKGGLPNFVEVL